MNVILKAKLENQAKKIDTVQSVLNELKFKGETDSPATNDLQEAVEYLEEAKKKVIGIINMDI